MADTPTPAPVPVPRRVAKTAAARGLGDPVAASRRSNPLGNTVILAALAVVCFGLAALCGLLGARGLSFALTFGGALATVVVLTNLRGVTRAYLFTGGLVVNSTGILRCAHWRDINRLVFWRAAGPTTDEPGRLLGVYVLSSNRRRLFVDLAAQSDDHLFTKDLRTYARTAGVPVVDGGPHYGELRP
ncbi:MAG: hypothetical protein IRZ08_05500 [Frankia sp.]|nr:hypothetical protein [Frankia sp.]